ncbi:neuromedin-S-like [Cyprinus carpio]|uniref:Neuromedin-S-like n=1 Tax=Cyprinus carpio TaxID=7962 RepID=A0A9Q9Y045_CYPCA|nr:neuromedin-S-like [Cyprinus carpio]
MMGGVCLFCSSVLFISVFCSSVESFPRPLTDCDDYGDYVQGSAVLSSLCGVEWRNQDQEQIQNVFKRFLFHYSKAHNSVGSVERESHSVHPLMRLSPKLSLRRKKQQTKNVCRSSRRRLRDVLCSYLGF